MPDPGDHRPQIPNTYPPRDRGEHLPNCGIRPHLGECAVAVAEERTDAERLIRQLARANAEIDRAYVAAKRELELLARGIAAPARGASVVVLDLVAHLHRQREFSLRTFGPGTRTDGVVDHVRKELREIERAASEAYLREGGLPNDALEEWIDVVLLALDGAWRCGASPEQIAAALTAKQAKNEQRKWPDWRTADRSRAIEHVRDEEGSK